MPKRIKLQDCLWVHGAEATNPLFQPLVKEVARRNIPSVLLTKAPQSITALQEQLRKSDAHVIFHYLQPREFNALKPILEIRKNYSILLVDWWLAPFWFTRNAEYLMFNLYNGIAARLGGKPFGDGYRPPLLSFPETKGKYHLQSAALRPLALLAQPFLDWQRKRQRAKDNRDPQTLIYLPISFVSERLPLRNQQTCYDVANMGDTCGYWLPRDPYVPARYAFSNLYADRKALIDSILKYENNPFKVVDRRRSGLVEWEVYCSAIRQSRLAIVTGGVQQASVPKFIEYACMGTPMIGTTLPYEHPWLSQCLFEINALGLTPAEVKAKLLEALDQQPRLRQNCLELRSTLLERYSPSRIFDMAQAQIDGQPVFAGYLKQDLKLAPMQHPD